MTELSETGLDVAGCVYIPPTWLNEVEGILQTISSLGPLCLGRYNEWGRAVLGLQKERLRTNAGTEYFFCAYTSGDGVDSAALKSEIAGTLMTDLPSVGST